MLEPTLSPESAGRADRVGWVDLPARSKLLVGGGDGARFVDKFTTASIARLAEGQGTEGFFTDARGWVIALANILRTSAGVWIDGPPGIAATLVAHLGHYHIREDVTFVDDSAARASLLVAGGGAAAWLASQGVAVPDKLLDHAEASLGGIPVALVRTDWYGADGFLVSAARRDASHLTAWLAAKGLPRLSAAAVDAARIEACSPEPADIPQRTLPQELGRDARAISFTKGCYLGQETVARLDALGHVNRRLVALAIESAVVPAVGATVTAAGDAVGVLTSAGASSRLGLPVGLAIVHERGLAPSVGLEVAGARASVLSLPGGGKG